jgi:hypothetical protein
MTTGSIILRGGLLALFLSSGCSSGDDASTSTSMAPSTKAAVASQTAAPAKASSPAVVAPMAGGAPIAARGTLFQRLPKSTLCALRLPHVEKLKAAYERTSLHDLMEMPQFAVQRAQLDTVCAETFGTLAQDVPDFDALKSQLLAIEGELVVAIVSIDALALSKSSDEISGCPLTCALMFDAGAHADDVDKLLQRCFALLEAKISSQSDSSPGMHVETVASSADGWHRRLRPEGALIEIAREGSQFLLQLGPGSGGALETAPLPTRTLADSFAATDIVRATPDLATHGAEPVVEAFLNLEPVWSAVELLAPAEAKSILAATGATSIHGLSATAALGQTGIDEVLLVHSPGGNDLLTRVLTDRPLDAKLARFVPAEARSASLGTFDVGALFDAVSKLLPPEQKTSLDQALASQKKEGFDLRRDLIDNIGPTFGFTGDADLLGMFTGQQPLGQKTNGKELDFTLIAQLKDGARFHVLIEQFLSRGGLDKHQKKIDIHGFLVHAFEAVPMPRPDGTIATTIEPHLYVGDDVLLLSLSRTGMQRALAAALNNTNRGPSSLKSALDDAAASSTFSIGVTAAAEGHAASTTIGRRTASGLEVSQLEGPGTGSAYALVGGLGIGASVAIPSLMAARRTANDKAAAATLRSIASAEAKFREQRLVDLDGDGVGDFGTLAELTGAAGLRGGGAALDQPLLSTTLKPDEKGLAQHTGYVFRLDLAAQAGGSTHGARSDGPRFVAYAWPIANGATGAKVFAIDSEGHLLASDNRGKDQRYEARVRMPKTEALFESSTARKGGDVRAQHGGQTDSGSHAGRDGGIWHLLE